jgi:hypothetical protein
MVWISMRTHTLLVFGAPLTALLFACSAQPDAGAPPVEPPAVDAGEDGEVDAAATSRDAGAAPGDAAARDAAVPIFVRDGNAASPASCETVCVRAGHTSCFPDYEWNIGGRLQKAGGRADYVRRETGGVVSVGLVCDAVPTPTKNLANFTRELERYSCACR